METYKIEEIKNFTESGMQGSGWNKDLSAPYALINGRWYEFCALESITGCEHGGTLLPINKSILDRFIESPAYPGFFEFNNK